MGPLKGFKIVEIAGIGPGQLCGMLLADMGAQLIRIDRPDSNDLGKTMPDQFNLMNRNRPTVAVDLKSENGIDFVLRLCQEADAVFEGFRPGVMEGLGLGPEDCMAANERLVYGRMTGWGQEGPLANSVGHDSNYIALAGALNAIGDKNRPPPMPLNLIGDFGGGALYLAVGMLAAMLETSKSGKGQIVDAAMVDGVASMMTLFYGMMAAGLWSDNRESNLLDGAAPFARSYATSDGKFVAVCALESRFFKALLQTLNITGIELTDQNNPAKWAEHTEIFSQIFKQKTRDEWEALFAGTDSCVSPVLSMVEAPEHAHSQSRNTYVTVDGIKQPGPAPRFSRTQSDIRHGPTSATEVVEEALLTWGLSRPEIQRLCREGVVLAR